MVSVKIIGALGYGGVGMVELLLRHPEVEIKRLVDVEYVGQKISDVWPHLAGYCDLPISSPDDDTSGETDVVFCATPDGVGMRLAEAEVESGARVVDYSGDFRFDNPAVYADYASRIGHSGDHSASGLLEKSAYGIAELHRNAIAKAPVVGNPGCFAVATTLGLAPVARERCADLTGLVSDAKTGVSGAGKKPNAVFHYPARYDNMNAYKIAAHQHQFEIERELALLAGDPVTVTLTTQVVPMCRGIMATLYGKLEEGWDRDTRLVDLYRDFYKNEPFVRVVGPDESACAADVRGSNRCLVWINIDPHAGRFVVVSHIDNLMKGQAGSALQNMNVMFGLEETLGLNLPGSRP